MSELNASNFKKEEGGQGPDLVGTAELTSPYFMVPPSGTTAERPENPQEGALRFNTDVGTLEYYKGVGLGWESIVKTTPNLGGGNSIDHGMSNTGTGARAIFAGGYAPGSNPNDSFNNVDYLTISTLGNTQDFGDLTAALAGGYATADRTRVVLSGGIGPRAYTPGTTVQDIQSTVFASTGNFVDGGDLGNTRAFGAAVCDATRSINASRGMPSYNNVIDYFNTQTAGNGQEFGDIHAAKGYATGMMSTTRGLIAGGIYCCPAVSYNIVEYVTIQSTGNAVDFGDISTTRYEMAGFGSPTRGMIACGSGSSNVIEYFNIATLGNGVDFGDATNQDSGGKYGVSSPTRGVFGGGSPGFTNTLEFVQIQTTGNSTDFGDFTSGRKGTGQESISNAHGGL